MKSLRFGAPFVLVMLSCASSAPQPVPQCAAVPEPAKPEVVPIITKVDGVATVDYEAVTPPGYLVSTFAGIEFYSDDTVTLTEDQLEQYHWIVAFAIEKAAQTLGIEPYVVHSAIVGYKVFLTSEIFLCPPESAPEGAMCLGLTYLNKRTIWVEHHVCAANSSLAHELAHVFHVLKDGRGDGRHDDPEFFYAPSSITEVTNTLVERSICNRPSMSK